MRRLAKTLSVALSLGLLMVLVWPFEAERRPPPKAQPKPAAVDLPPAISLAAVQLPPPPAPKAPPVPPTPPTPSKQPIKPLKPVAKAEAKPAPPQRPFLKPAIASKPKSSPKLEPKFAPKPSVERNAKPPVQKDEPQTVKPDAVAVTEGRALLRLLEHGSGPLIEIAWPESRAAQAQLYGHFGDCYGLRVAVLAGENRLFVAVGPPGAPWRLNLDAYSGFMRQHGASAAPAEAQELHRIRERHRLPLHSAAVRIFPRHVDALLLGGLQAIIGADYAKRQTIRARYVLRNSRVFVENVRADGRRVAGRIDLSPAARRACRSGHKV